MTEMDPRRDEALRTARSLFTRFGYRKTSMEDVARAVGVSRQGLYLWYPSKKALFRAVIEHLYDEIRTAVGSALDGEAPLPERLVAACDAAHGRFMDIDLAARDELVEAGQAILGGSFEVLERWVQARIAAELSPRAGMDADTLASLLLGLSRDSKHVCPDRDAFRARMLQAVNLVLA